jgi:hypothetical protein
MLYNKKTPEQLTGEELDEAQASCLQGMLDAHDHYNINKAAFLELQCEQERREAGATKVN